MNCVMILYKEVMNMKLREEFTCPLELVHDMIKGKWKHFLEKGYGELR